MADVIWVDGGARNPTVPTLFQVADVDTGVINWVNADQDARAEGLSLFMEGAGEEPACLSPSCDNASNGGVA